MTEHAPVETNTYVVDDDPGVRRAMRRLLTACGYSVECFDSAECMLSTLPEGSTGCALLDIRLPDVDGPQLQVLLSTHSPAVSIVFLTGYGEVCTAVHALKHGAVDYLLKPVSEEDLIPVVREALRRSAETRARLALEQRLSEALARLSRREREVMEHVVSGRLNKQIAAELGIAEKTVKVHRSRVMAKMGVRNVPALVRKCLTLGVSDTGTTPL